MRAVICKDSVRIEFSGRGQMWNELLRPYVGGPEAPAEPETADGASAPAASPAPAPFRAAPVQPAPQRPDVQVAPAPAPMPAAAAVAVQPARPAAPPPVRTWYPPRPAQQARPAAVPQVQPPPPVQHYSSGEDESDAVQVEPSADPATLYTRLSEIPGRRSERDGVLAAVWFLTRGERETSADEVEAHFASLSAFPDVKVVPLLLKHVHRTKTLEQGSTPKAVRLTAKGITAVRGRLVPV